MRFPYAVPRLAVATLLLATVGATTADESLGEIVVTAHRPIVEQAGTVRELDAEQIDDLHAASLDEALAWLPGVNVRTAGNGTPRIDVRGLRTRHVKLLLNGIPMNSAADGNFDPTQIPAEWIERIKLTPGASSQLYGDGALGGVINVITHQASGRTGSLHVEGGNDGSTRLGGSFGWGSDVADIFVSVTRADTDGFDLADGFTRAAFEDGGRRLNSQRLRNSLLAQSSWRPVNAWELGLTFQFSNGDHGIPTGIFDNTTDPYAQRPKFDRVTDEQAWFLQASARYEPEGRWRHHAWGYATQGQTSLSRYEDARFLRGADDSVRNVFDDQTETRTIGAHHQTEFVHETLGTLAVMLEGREEQLVGECLIQDVPLAVPTPPPPPPPHVPDTLVLDYTLTTTNNAGITGRNGGHDPIARLTATNRADGGIDFSLTNLAGQRYGSNSFLQSVFLSPRGGFDPTGLGFQQALGSAGEIGNVRFFQALEDADGYAFPIQVNFKRPGQGDPLLTGETASWIFNKGRISDFFAVPVAPTVGQADPIYSAIRLRNTDANGFWGQAPVDLTGGGAFNRVFVGALTPIDPNAPPPPPLDAGDALAGQLVPNRVCGGGAGGGDGSGGEGDGSGGNRVERLPGYRFGKRMLQQDRAIDVLTAAAEWSFNPLTDVGVVAGVGSHWLRDDHAELQGAPSYNLAATWRVSEGLRLKASHARKARPPSIAQLYDPASGNTSLDFERAEITEAGIRKAFGFSSSAEVTLFHQDVSGLIQRDVATGLFENVARTRFDGVEFAGQTTLRRRLTLQAAYTYLYSRDESPATPRKEQQYTPGNSLAVSAGWRASERWSLHAGLRHVTDQVYYSRVVASDRRELPAYTLVDATLRYTLPGQHITLYSGIENLFDEDYAESYGLPRPGRYVFAGVKFDLR